MGKAGLAVLLVFVMIPAAYTETSLLGFRGSGWGWVLILSICAPLALTAPVSPNAARHLAPYLAFLVWAVASLSWASDFGVGQKRNVQFLVQIGAPAVVYLLASRERRLIGLTQLMSQVAKLGIALAAVLSILTTGARNVVFGIQVSPRPMAIALVILFVVATMTAPPWRVTLVLWAVAAGITVWMGSRMASVVLLMMLVTTPAARLRPRLRASLAIGMVVLLILFSQTAAFKQRFFFDEDASLRDAVTLSNNLDTSGRRELWPALFEACSTAPLTGFGIGASYGLSTQVTAEGVEHPHNDYLRMYCDVGLVGSALFWAFFVWAAVRAWRARKGRNGAIHTAALQAILALAVFAITDNPVAYTAHFMMPTFVLIAVSDALLPKRRSGLRPTLAMTGARV